MPTVHFVNVSPGDCSIIQHASGRATIIDICDGYYDASVSVDLLRHYREQRRMTEAPTNPLAYAANRLGLTEFWRFVLTHPDMDHMDGLDALFENFTVQNFWDTGAKREKPSFDEGTAYVEADWDRYESLVAGTESGVTVLHPLAGSKFKFANRNEDGQGAGDGIYVCSPNAALVKDASDNEDSLNDASYVLCYNSQGGRIVFPGDAHDKTWEFACSAHAQMLGSCHVLIAPHHGRHSDRSYDFLNLLKPKLTLFGSAPYEHQAKAYAQWDKRNLPYISSDEAGTVVMECESGGIRVFVENPSIIPAGSRGQTNAFGYRELFFIPK